MVRNYVKYKLLGHLNHIPFFHLNSVKSNASAENENLDKLLKTIAKDSMQNIDSRNTTVKLTVNKTAEHEHHHGTDTLKKLNNKVMLSSSHVAGTLPPDQVKCNILKGTVQAPHSYPKTAHSHVPLPPFAARGDEEFAHKVNNQSFAAMSMSSDGGPESLNAATFVSVVSCEEVCRVYICVRSVPGLVRISMLVVLLCFLCAYHI